MSELLTNILNRVGDLLFSHTQNTVDYNSNSQCFSSFSFFFLFFIFFLFFFQISYFFFFFHLFFFQNYFC